MKTIAHNFHDEESNSWPWITEARARDAKAIEGMSIDEQLVYYRRMAAIARAEREEQVAMGLMMSKNET